MESSTTMARNGSNNRRKSIAMKGICVMLFLMLYLIQIHVFLATNSEQENWNQHRSKRKRKADSELPWHQKRKRVLWSPLVRTLGPDIFRTHHRISLTLFNKIHERIKKHIRTNPKYARKTCCRGDVSNVDSRARLSMTLEHLGGSRTCSIAHMHGVSRQTVGLSIRKTFDAIIKEFPISPFPFHDENELQKIADGFKSKSTGGLFDSVVGAVDGFLLRINKTCIGNKSGTNDPSKYYCRKKYYAVNCQVCCDANRKVLALSMLCPGAVPDTIAHLKSAVHHGIETEQLPQRFHFIGALYHTHIRTTTTPGLRACIRLPTRIPHTYTCTHTCAHIHNHNTHRVCLFSHYIV